MIPQEWEWPIAPSHQQHRERLALLRPIPYEMTAPIDQLPVPARQGRALSLNISSGGMLLLMGHAPAVEQVLRVHVPTPLAEAETPTLAEVRWTRKVPFDMNDDQATYLVGLKFMF